MECVNNGVSLIIDGINKLKSLRCKSDISFIIEQEWSDNDMALITLLVTGTNTLESEFCDVLKK